MFERFNDRARKIMALANQEAQRFHHDCIGPEHILLGLIKEGSGVGANVLKNLGVDLSSAREGVERLMKPGSENPLSAKLESTPRAKQVVENAIHEAIALNHKYVGTEHMLLGLISDADSIAAQVLINHGISLEQAREIVTNLLGGEPASNEPDPDTNQKPYRSDTTRSLNQAIQFMWNHTKPDKTVTTAHLLAALLRVPDSLASRILSQHGISERIIEDLAIKFYEESPEP